jgi:hypothetical protein
MALWPRALPVQAQPSELDASFWLPNEMAPGPSPMTTPVPGGPSKLAAPGAKQHVGRVQLALIGAK